MYEVFGFYRFLNIQYLKKNKRLINEVLIKNNIRGTVIISKEGVNGTISGKGLDIKTTIYKLKKVLKFKDFNSFNKSKSLFQPFHKPKVKIKTEVVPMNLKLSQMIKKKDSHVEPNKWNKLIRNKKTLVIDARKPFEYDVGTFKGSTNPNIDNFRDFPKYLKNLKKNQPIAMFCTGGIRCEKASAYFKHKGFKNVYQLEGGIIEYARQVKNQGLNNKFVGKNFVFDERRSEAISEDVIARCHQCGSPCDTHVNCANEACHLLFIQCPSCAEKLDSCCSDTCAEIIALPESDQKALRKGKHNSNKIFKKGRAHHLKTVDQS